MPLGASFFRRRLGLDSERESGVVVFGQRGEEVGDPLEVWETVGFFSEAFVELGQLGIESTLIDDVHSLVHVRDHLTLWRVLLNQLDPDRVIPQQPLGSTRNL